MIFLQVFSPAENKVFEDGNTGRLPLEAVGREEAKPYGQMSQKWRERAFNPRIVTRGLEIQTIDLEPKRCLGFCESRSETQQNM
ncbi:hypothetical protein, partial [Paenibacillus ehimensis]